MPQHKYMTGKSKSFARRVKKVRSGIFGTKVKPRLTVFRSNKGVYAQVINDEEGVTLAAASEKEILSKKTAVFGKITKSSTKSDSDKPGEDLVKEEQNTLRPGEYRAYQVGILLAAKASKKKIKSVVFDRGGYKYHGRIKALADGAREGGLKF